MKRLTAAILPLLCILLAGPMQAADPILPVKAWTCKTKNPKPKDWEVRRGGARIFQCTFLDYNDSAMNLSNATQVLFNYTPANPSTNTTYYSITGAVYSAASGIVRATWTTASESTQDYYQYEFVVKNSSNTLVEASGKLRLLPGVTSSATPTAPTAITSIDWAAVQESNTDQAPYIASATPAYAYMVSRTSYWDTAYGWGNYAASAGWLYMIANTSNWGTAYGWGDHSAAGYASTNTTASLLAQVTSNDLDISYLYTSNAAQQARLDTVYGWGDWSVDPAYLYAVTNLNTWVASNGYGIVRTGRNYTMAYPTNVSFYVNDAGYLTPTTGDQRYVPLAGGTMTGNLTNQQNITVWNSIYLYGSLYLDPDTSTRIQYAMGDTIFYNQNVEIMRMYGTAGLVLGVAGNPYLWMYGTNSIRFGQSTNYWMKYNATGTQFELWGTDVDGSGTDGLIGSIPNGTDDLKIAGDIYEGGTALASKYLGIVATAADSDKLGGTAAGDYATGAELDARTLTNSFTWCDNSQSSVTNPGPRLNETNTIQRITYWCCGGSAVVNLYSGHWTNTAPSAVLSGLEVTTARQETNVSIGIAKDWLLSYWPTNTAWTNLYLDIMMERQD